jgi:hypothetical protein
VLAAPSAVSTWRAGAWRDSTATSAAGAKLVALPPPRERAGRGLGETIQRRGSTREFGHASLTAEELATTLWAATRSLDADVPGGLVDLYLIVNAVEGVPPGAYVYRPDLHALETLATGEFRNRSAYLLEQPPATRRLSSTGSRDSTRSRARSAIGAIASRISRRDWPAAAPTSPPTRKDSARPGSRSMTATSWNSSRRTPPAKTRSS